MKSTFRVVAVLFAALIAWTVTGDGCFAAPPGGAPGGMGRWRVGTPHFGPRHSFRNNSWGWGGHFDSWATLYRQGRIPIPPYFSLHPPVYYSQPVPRTYGYSPHAYPGWVPTPEIVAPQPATIINPHVAPQVDESSSSVSPPPKVTYNPFVKRGFTAKEEKLARVVKP